ncbi:alpha-hydroxy-acid oxidizing protein [Sphingomonas aracearum]|uniref:Lactate 2-monooxygenase n=1 Tax=Sphingomonas aracearum TaxID=2283317 RepID=A0A369VU85_9SPHN|nr:alpha-hydroxy-acid oxidizing protein [Sphingomonas aracearum]RDE05918.1 lactate 2-monooxygenase [Sphingomonas aracearum]
MSAFGTYQNEIYAAGLRGIVPKVPVDAKTLEARATAAMAPSLLHYVQGGCGDEWTQDQNVEAFHHWGMVPRMMVETGTRDLSVDLFGTRYDSPIFLAPIGVTGMATPDGHGDIAAAQASAQTGVPMVVSTLGNDTLEEVATHLGKTPGFFQLYCPRDRELAESLVRRAEAAGYRGLVVTLDTWVTGFRPRDLNTGNFPQLRGHVLVNYTSDPVFRARLGKDPASAPQEAIMLWGALFGRPMLWDDIAWLRSVTTMPIILKGICHPDDAARAADLGADAIYCSNHGGRQANGGIAAIDMLPDVIRGAGSTPVWFDSGVRSGTDVVKALAMGAAAVGIGRPFVYGLALDGAAGAIHVLRSILAEADLFMAVNGMPTIADLRREGVRRL